LGFSLILSFTVIFGITYYSTGYVLTNPVARAAVSLVVALTIFMFDRALFQSDWFQQTKKDDAFKTSWTILRMAIRLTISFGIAYVLSLFLELAIFSDTIGEKIKHDHLAANKLIYEKIELYEAQLNSEIAQHRKDLTALEALYQRELTDDAPLDVAAQSQFDGYEQQKRSLDRREGDLRAELRATQDKIITYQEDMNAEELGHRLRTDSSGLQGLGPKYQFARRQKEIYEQRATELQLQISALNGAREELTTRQRRLTAEALARRNEERVSSQDKRGELRRRIEQSRQELNVLEANRTSKIEEFRRTAMANSDFQKLKDDPMSRMTAYAELKADQKQGRTIVFFSLLTVMFVIFLEVVPVLAKMFFSPLSAYGQIIRSEVELTAQDAEHRSRMDDIEKRGRKAEKDLELVIREKAAGI